MTHPWPLCKMHLGDWIFLCLRFVLRPRWMVEIGNKYFIIARQRPLGPSCWKFIANPRRKNVSIFLLLTTIKPLLIAIKDSVSRKEEELAKRRPAIIPKITETFRIPYLFHEGILENDLRYFDYWCRIQLGTRNSWIQNDVVSHDSFIICAYQFWTM